MFLQAVDRGFYDSKQEDPLDKGNANLACLDETIADIYIKQIPYKLIKDVPSEPLQERIIVAVNEPPMIPATPRASRRVTPYPKFFDGGLPPGSNEKIDQNEIKRSIETDSKDLFVVPINGTQIQPLTILERRTSEGPRSFMSVEQFNEKIAQGRISRCINLFESRANKNAIKLLRSLSPEDQRKLREQLKKDKKVSLADEVEILIAQESLLGSEDHEWGVSRCRLLFEEEKPKEAMIWAVTLTQRQKKKLINDFIEVKRFDDAVKIATLMKQEDMKLVCSRLLQEKQYDPAMYLLCKFRYNQQDYFVEQCRFLVVSGRGDLALGIACAKLNDDHRYQLCMSLMDKCDPKTITQIAGRMKDGADKQKIMDWLKTKIITV
jgi:hypothetical protein